MVICGTYVYGCLILLNADAVLRWWMCLYLFVSGCGVLIVLFAFVLWFVLFNYLLWWIVVAVC